MAIEIRYKEAEGELFGMSKLWGCADLPHGCNYPEVEWVNEDGMTCADPMTFICQIRLQDIAAYDSKNLLPHTGMLYFFADIDYFLGNLEADSPGMGQWDKDRYRVLYAPETEHLDTHRIVCEDGTAFGLPAQELSFVPCEERADGFKLLGKPYFEETEEEYPHYISLLQLDCNDDWRLQFYDCGMLNFLITPEDLAARKWEQAICHLHSF